MFEEIRRKLWEFLDWDEETEECIWREDGPKKVSALEILTMFMELTSEIEENFINEDHFLRHFHTEHDSVVREVRTQR